MDEPRYHPTTPLWPYAPDVLVDENIVELLRLLNESGFCTEYSCEGDTTGRAAYFSFTDIAHLPDVVEMLTDLLERSGHDDEAARMRWNPELSGAVVDTLGRPHWSVRLHRTNGVWGFSVYLPPAWAAAMESAATALRAAQG